MISAEIAAQTVTNNPSRGETSQAAVAEPERRDRRAVKWRPAIVAFCRYLPNASRSATESLTSFSWGVRTIRAFMLLSYG
jgi:hypothetical protein